ncbi:MAG: PTS sugar transporter subunit IIA, partial [Planctomycetota bacterium]
GPTVIAPMLKRIRISPRLHSILHWEAVLIDPIGVFIAVLCFEWLAEEGGPGALLNLGIRVGVGMGVGVAGGMLMLLAVRHRAVPRETVNVFALAGAVLIFGLAEAIISKAGLLAVTVSGFIFGLAATAGMKQVRRFKAELTDLLIGTLFILLAARLDFAQFQAFGAAGALVVVLTMLVIRPLGIAVCGFGLDLSGRERLFLSWVAPRGIVAASLASLIAISFERRGVADPRFVETFTYSVIIATIVLQGLTAGAAARLLGVSRPEPRGWLLIGAHGFAQRLAGFIRDTAGLPVLLVDTNARSVNDARARGYTAIHADAREAHELIERHQLTDVGSLLALTDNEDLNSRLCAIWGDVLGFDRTFRCNPVAAMPGESEDETSGRVVWPMLARPSLLATELLRGEADTTITPSRAEPPPGLVALARFDGHQVELDPEPSDATAEQDVTLYLHREADHLARSVRPELVATIDGGDMRGLFDMLVTRMVALEPTLPREATVNELIDRETAVPTVIGHGVAVPHTYSGHITDRLCAIAQLPGQLPYPPPDGARVNLVFLVISPQGDPEGHLAALADIARLVSTAERRESLLSARSPLEVVRIVREARDRPAG